MEQGFVEGPPVAADPFVHPEPSQGPDPELPMPRVEPAEACGLIPRPRRRGHESPTRLIIRKGEVLDPVADAVLDLGL
jgi:hypothetical protein